MNFGSVLFWLPASKPLQFISRQLNQWPDRRGIELKLAARRRKQFRQRTRAAEREGFFVIVQRLRLVAPRIRPDLQRAKLRDAVFDVVKRMDENVQLPVPRMRTRFFKTSPINVAAEAVHQFQIRRLALGARVAGVRINCLLYTS